MDAKPRKRTPQTRRKPSDTSDYVGYSCAICGEPVRVSYGNGYWSQTAKGEIIEAAHTTCKFPIR